MMEQRIVELYTQAIPITQIAKECGLTVGQVKYRLRKWKSDTKAANGQLSLIQPDSIRQSGTARQEQATRVREAARWELPDYYGENTITLMAQSPTTLFAYWEITWPRMRMVASYLQADYREIQKGIRLYDVTDRYFDGNNAHYHRDILMPDDRSTCYVSGVQPGRTYIVDFALFHGGRCCPILRSQPVVTPRSQPAVWGEPLVEPITDPGRPDWFEHFVSYSLYEK